MYHSVLVRFGENYGTEKDTYRDYHLITMKKPMIPPPEVQTEYVDVPGMDGQLDLTGVVDGKIHFKNRQASWDFAVHPRHHFYTVLSTLLNDIHGKPVQIIMPEDDPNYAYYGRVIVSGIEGENFLNKITWDLTLQPHKRRISGLSGPIISL